MTASDLYKRLQETNGRRLNKQKFTRVSERKSKADPGDLLRNTAIGKATALSKAAPAASAQTPPRHSDDPRRAQMLKVLRASEARHKRKSQRDAIIGIGDLVNIKSGPFANTAARVCDLDYINSVAMVEREGTADRVWLSLNILTPAE